MVVHGLGRDVQRLADLGVGQSVGDEDEHVDLSPRQGERVLPCRPVGRSGHPLTGGAERGRDPVGQGRRTERDESHVGRSLRVRVTVGLRGGRLVGRAERGPRRRRLVDAPGGLESEGGDRRLDRERTTRFTMLVHLPREEGYRIRAASRTGRRWPATAPSR